MTNIEASSDFKDLAQESTLEKVWFPAYLTFTVCFYSLRFIFGWGSALTTGYVSDMPPYLAALKDVVWLGLLGAALCSRAIGRAIDQAKRHPAIYLLLGSFCGWMLLCAGIHMMYYSEPLNDSFLYNARMPLEYIPAALLAPAFIGNWRRVGMIWKRLNWVAIGFAVFEFVSVLGGWKHTGFDWGGPTVRFGGILGSPNDWGIYSGCAIVAILAVTKARLQLLGFVPGLLLSQSRSSIVGCAVAMTPLLYRSDLRRELKRLSVLLLVVGFAVWFFVPPGFSNGLLPEHAGLDESASIRFDEMNKFQHDFVEVDEVGPLLFGVRYSLIESFYVALLARGGLPALAFYAAAIGMSMVRGWRFRKSSVPHLVALSVVVLISTASLFIPYPDVYPTNFYLWLFVGVLWMEPLGSSPWDRYSLGLRSRRPSNGDRDT